MTNERRKVPNIAAGILRTLIQVMIPLLLILGNVRLVLVTANIWIPIEYRLPGFPDDPYGFSLEDRLKWSKIDVEYLLNDESVDYFDSFRLESGEPMHNERELRHMQDVKVLVQQSWLAFRIGLVLLIFFLLILGGSQGYDSVWKALQKGFLWTLILLGVLFVVVVVAFGFLFVGFHRLFFEGETWIFQYSDTFIRLYPERFWRDVFIFLAVLTAAEAGLLYWIIGKVIHRMNEARPQET
jgi:integral membrane protein (TIGR01906 family)